MAKDDFFSFEEALDELRLKEEELKRLVSEGEIRAFREGDTMKLRKQDVENLRSELSGGGEVVDLGDTGEELVFEDDADFDETGMATEEISEADTILEDDVEDVGEVDIEEDYAPARSRTAAAAPVAATTRRRAIVDEDEDEGMGLKVAMIGTAIVLVVAIPVCWDMTQNHIGGFTQLILGMFGMDPAAAPPQ